MSGNVYYFYRVRILISCLTLYFISLISTPYIFNTNKQKSLTKCSKLLYFLYNFVFFCIFANVMNDCQKHERANKQHACLQNAGFHYNISFFPYISTIFDFNQSIIKSSSFEHIVNQKRLFFRQKYNVFGYFMMLICCR